MKRVIFTSVLLIYTALGNAQSDSLRYAYNQVCKTLKEYKCSSQDVNDCGGYYAKTISIKFEIQQGAFLFTFNDDFCPFDDPAFGHRHGIKRIKIPINEMELASALSYKAFWIKGKNGVEIAYKGQKEILTQYSICGENLSLKKLRDELQIVQKYVIEEGFTGNLNQNSSKPTPQKVSPPPQTEKKMPVEQPQQRTRKRIASGN